MSIKVGDKVVVIAGSCKGSEGKVKKVLKNEDRLIIEGVNMVKKHTKGNGQESGGIVDREAPIHRSNVMIIDPKTNKTSRIGHEVTKDGKKVRVTKKSNEKID